MININSPFGIDIETAFPFAHDRFINACGLDLSIDKHKRMYSIGMKVFENGKSGLEINSLVSYFDKSYFKDGMIQVYDLNIKFNLLNQINKESLIGIYFYGLTVGECKFESEEKIMEFLYADIWGTAFVDAAVEILKSNLIEDVKKRTGLDNVGISPSMGPGYYGMPVSETEKMEKLIDFKKIGIEVKPSGMLIPQKSCSGFFLIFKDNFKFPKECTYCTGNSLGCEFCKLRKGKNDEANI